VSLVAGTLGVGRSTVYDRLTGRTRTRGSYTKAQDTDLLPRICQIAAQRPTYGYRRIAADRLLLARRYTERADDGHDGVVVAIRSNLRWCSDGFEFTCWNGEVVRGAFVIDARDREIIAWRAVANAGISGSDVRDIMLEAVKRRCSRSARTGHPRPLLTTGMCQLLRRVRIGCRLIENRSKGQNGGPLVFNDVAAALAGRGIAFTVEGHVDRHFSIPLGTHSPSRVPFVIGILCF
jgi:hypothetical protein